MKTIATWLPVFPGFYSTIFEPDEENEIDYITSQRNDNNLPELPFEAYNFDYAYYFNNTAISCCNFIENELKDFVTSIKFDSVNSPREYNFANDSIFCEISLSDENIKAIKHYLFENTNLFTEYIKSKYTSYDGFLSSYSNDGTEWLANIDDCLAHTHKLGSILEFIVRNLWSNSYDIEGAMFESCSDCYLSVSNYEDCCNSVYCTECKTFVKKENAISSTCKDCYDYKSQSFEIIVCSECHTEIINAWSKRQFQVELKLGHIKKVVCNDCLLLKQ
jgi:hypothetical protein